MKFSTRTTYGIRAISRLASSYGKETLSLPKIAKIENISKSYLERLFSILKKEGLIESSKGVDGGYRLSKSPKQITVYEVVKVLEGDMVLFFCMNEDGEVICKSKKTCSASKVLLEIQKSTKKTLESMTLKDLI